MKIFVVGMPKSGRTTVSKALSQIAGYRRIDASSWVKDSFRDQLADEHDQQYHDELHIWLTNRMKNHPNMIADNVRESIAAYNRHAEDDCIFVVDGIVSPRDFTNLFDINKDIVVFLNRTNNQEEYKDYESIGVSVMRDYCFWLSSADLIEKNRWFEYNFTIPGDDSNYVKNLGHKNSVFIVRSISKVISHLKDQLTHLQRPHAAIQS